MSETDTETGHDNGTWLDFFNLAEPPILLTASDLFATKTVICLNPQSLRNAGLQLSIE